MGNGRWIILIDKTPRGPLTEEEVRALVAQKLVRLNDLALQISDNPAEKKSEWKFLWQHAEFDRRKEQAESKSNQKGSGVPGSPQERREQVDSAALEEKKKNLLPEEIAGIHADDLAYHSTVHSGRPLQPTHLENALCEYKPSAAETIFARFNWRALAAIPILLVAGIAAFKFQSSSPSFPNAKKEVPLIQVPEDEGQGEFERDINSAVTGSPLRETAPSEGPKIHHRPIIRNLPADPSTSAPASDAGDVSYEEYRRAQEERLDRERQEEEERRLAEEAAEEEEVAPKKKKKAEAEKVEPTEGEEAVEGGEEIAE